MIQTQAVNHAILTLKPIPSIPLLQQYSFSVPYLDAYSSICFRVRARIRGAAIFLLVVLVASSLGGAFGVRYCRRTVWTAALPQKGKMLFPTRMPIPPSGPEEARLWHSSQPSWSHSGDQRQKAGTAHARHKRQGTFNRHGRKYTPPFEGECRKKSSRI